MRFWPIINMNNMEETYSNEFNSRSLRSERISKFVSQSAEKTLKVGGHTWSHKPFTISEMKYSLTI